MAGESGPSASDNLTGGPTWRDDLDALQFDLPEGAGQAVVHRRAFRVFAPDPTPSACIELFQANRAAFEAVASAKIERDSLPKGARFHLTSRDLATALEASKSASNPAV